MRDASERLERFYGHLRRCRQLCNGKPFIEEHAAQGRHDCAAAKCRKHVCKLYAASSVRQIHAIISGAMSAAVRWGLDRVQPDALSAAARQEEATTATTVRRTDGPHRGTSLAHRGGLGSLHLAVRRYRCRRGEVVALQWADINLDRGEVRLAENYVRSADGMVLKETKTHQMRRLAIDAATVVLLRKHKEDCAQRLKLLGLEVTDRTWLFSAKPDFSQPRDPSPLTRRYGRLVTKLTITTALKELRHYSATELLTAGVDLRTVAGRLGHGDDTTTLRHYAAWVGGADKNAATTIALKYQFCQASRSTPKRKRTQEMPGTVASQRISVG